MLIKRKPESVGPRRLRTAVRIWLVIVAALGTTLIVYDTVRIVFFGESISHALRENWATVRPTWASIPAYVVWAVIFFVCYRRDRDERRRMASE